MVAKEGLRLNLSLEDVRVLKRLLLRQHSDRTTIYLSEKPSIQRILVLLEDIEI